MALPDLIEIVPLDKPVRAEITVPGSKSITNRALILAALADGEVTLTGALWSEDTQVMTEALRTLGFDVRVENDPAEFCNRTITVKGQGGKIPKAGTADKPLELFVGNAGTAARFLAAMVCLGEGVYRLSGVPRMHERPQAALFAALRELGYRVDATGDKLPAVIFGGRARHSVRAEPSVATERRARSDAPYQSCTVSIEESSQFASALLLSAKHGGWDVKVAGDDDEEAPYVTMTEQLVEVFPWTGGTFHIEPDASSGSYFWAVNDWEDISRLFHLDSDLNDSSDLCNWNVQVRAWPNSGFQIDANFPRTLKILSTLQKSPRSDVSDANRSAVVSRILTLGDTNPSLGDGIMTAIVASLIYSKIEIHFIHLARLRVQECERVEALKAESTKCGADICEVPVDSLRVRPSKLHGAEIETYNDHRMAMCYAILGLKVPGIKLKNPACVKKTFPNFFQKLAAAPPNGLGVEIWEVKDGQRMRKLAGEDLFAD